VSYYKTNNHCREKHDCYINLQKIQAGVIVPKYFLPAYSRMLHLNKKGEYVMVIWPTLQTHRREKTVIAHLRLVFPIRGKILKPGFG